jgi:hypothetical protein
VIFELPCAGFSFPLRLIVFLEGSCFFAFFAFFRLFCSSRSGEKKNLSEEGKKKKREFQLGVFVVSRDRLFIRLHLSLLLSVSRCRPDQKKIAFVIRIKPRVTRYYFSSAPLSPLSIGVASIAWCALSSGWGSSGGAALEQRQRCAEIKLRSYV